MIQDFGTLSCWGQNEVGLQKQPCVYNLVAAGKYYILLLLPLLLLVVVSLLFDDGVAFSNGNG